MKDSIIYKDLIYKRVNVMKIKKTSVSSFSSYTYTINSKDLISPINVDCQV
jgi:hypothetical protein